MKPLRPARLRPRLDVHRKRLTRNQNQGHRDIERRSEFAEVDDRDLAHHRLAIAMLAGRR